MGSRWKIYNEDVVAWAEKYSKTKFHALLCDPPYHLTTIVKRFGKKGSAPAQFGTDGVFARASRGFMGQQWDGGDIAFRPETWAAFHNVLYPGAFGMAFSAARNWHRLAAAIEDAGFILHPTIFLWANGQGFPKATNIESAINRKEGRKFRKLPASGVGFMNASGDGGWNPTKHRLELDDEESDLAKSWSGHRYGLQALKPAVEPIIVFQKPYEGKPLDNITQTGAGALNIDAGRIPVGDPVTINRFKDGAKPWGDGAGHEYETEETTQGRWPSNLILDESAAAKIGLEFFYTVSSKLGEADPVYYCGKVSAKERDAGLDDMESQNFGASGGAQSKLAQGEESYKQDSIGLNRITKRKNTHPTLKPIDLSRYLATLLLPPDAYAPRTILVPFSGAGSEMIGAGLAGWERIVGVESDTQNGYINIAEKRLEHWLSQKATDS